MGFYNLSKEERMELVNSISNNILSDIKKENSEYISRYFSDNDTYIRKSSYQGVGKIYFAYPEFQKRIISTLENLYGTTDEKIRQTVVNAAGEIGIRNFEPVKNFFDRGLFDEHHSVRNAVIGSMKKMGEKNPLPVFEWSKKYLLHTDAEIRREICHGLELRGRTHPEEILPFFKTTSE